jgi:signal transduction histidine kinase/ActR/RegA family two-component response regulator
MVGPHRFRCVLLVSACLAAGVPTLALGRDVRNSVALACTVAALLAAAVCLALRLREAQRVLDRAARAKSEFLTNVSHELRTPLNGIQGMAQLLARDCQTPEQGQMAAAIQSNCESLMAMITRIIDYARIEKGELQPQSGPVDLRQMVAEIAAVFGPKAANHGLAFETVLAPEVPRLVLGDSLHLREALSYLLDNGVKFTREGQVRLEVSVGGDPRECGAILFRVCDTGPGVPPEMARQLFSAFTQADGASTRAHGGLGLGLTLAHRLVGLMGGSIGFESPPGRGSVFWFLLPTVAVDPQPASPPEIASPVKGCRGRVLVVDDNPINQLVAVRAVDSLGYAADAAPGGEAALEALHRARYDAVLMDCQMPGMDGFETVAEIRREEARAGAGMRVPVIAMTANDPEAERAHCLGCGMDDYLAKPFRIAGLDQALDHWVASRVQPPRIA